eukprot:CAMPEP_0168315650 /NCGR_PEP_ID=MMETSP0210-20121227/12125_1 /TAXON_ID=40633 /ORGANISM="Condylostoma magnum, Strain COL2" /LENGTH=38 /DNA_ID= /DNA_START= /DNA_END= /DNA_ORIENTATION=
MEEDSDIFDELDPAVFPNDSGYGFCFDNIMPPEKHELT